MPHSVLDAPISQLRQRLIDDMNMRRFSPETQRNYLRDIGRLATFPGRSPDTATADDLRRFQIEQQEDGTDIRITQVLLGHAKLYNTALYTKVATRTVRTVTSPLDKLGLFKPGGRSPDS